MNDESPLLRSAGLSLVTCAHAAGMSLGSARGETFSLLVCASVPAASTCTPLAPVPSVSPTSDASELMKSSDERLCIHMWTSAAYPCCSASDRLKANDVPRA
eukprot:7379485-Prymnesium_polylepis.2